MAKITASMASLRRRGALTLTSLLALALAGGTWLPTPAAAADPTPAEIEAAAKAEGALVIYTSSVDAEMQVLVEAFEKRYPEITVEWIRQPSTTVFNRFVGEVEAGVVQADLLYTASTQLYQQRPELFRPLSAAQLPNAGAELPVKPKNDHYVIDAVSPHLVTYSTLTVSPEDLQQHLKSWKDLTDPRWNGKIALVDPKISTNIPSWLQAMRNAYGEEWLRAFGQNGIQIVGTGTAGAQQAVAGAYQIVVPTTLSHSAALRAQKAPVAVLSPEGPSHGLENGMAVPVKSGHPNAALLWANWKFSPEAQLLVCKNGQVPLMPVTDPSCPTLSPNHIGSDDAITAETQAALSALVGIKP